MRKQRDFITEITNSIKKLKCMKVLAEETPVDDNVPPVTPTNNEPVGGQATPTVNYEDLIAKARQQEKAKLYPQITKLEEEKKTLTEKNNTHLLTIGQKDAEIVELKKEITELRNSSNKGASEKESALLSKIETLEKELESVKATTISREEIEAEIKAEYEVKLYREQKLREVGDNVIPELVTGSTIEEIDNSIKVSQERFQQITSKVLGSVEVPVANANVSSFHAKDLKLEDIANLDPRSPEYAQLRAKLGLK